MAFGSMGGSPIAIDPQTQTCMQINDTLTAWWNSKGHWQYDTRWPRTVIGVWIAYEIVVVLATQYVVSMEKHLEERSCAKFGESLPSNDELREYARVRRSTFWYKASVIIAKDAKWVRLALLIAVWCTLQWMPILAEY